MTKIFLICMAFLYMVLPGVCAAGSLTDNGNGTVMDSGTLLMWQQGENSYMSWEAALSYCEGLTLATHTDWRLPNIKELSSIVDNTRFSPAINKTLFPNAIPSDYWSSTTVGSSGYTMNAWSVDFTLGGTYAGAGKSVRNYVRCVRGGL